MFIKRVDCVNIFFHFVASSLLIFYLAEYYFVVFAFDLSHLLFAFLSCPDPIQGDELLASPA